MQLPKSFTTVTTFSKVIALTLFVLLPFIGFYLGFKYNQSVFVCNPVNKMIVSIPRSTIIPTPYEPTSSPTISSTKSNDLKTYISNRFKFKFSYPSFLVVDTRYENSYPDLGGINLMSKGNMSAAIRGTGTADGNYIGFWAHSNPKELPLLEWMKENNSNSNYNDQELTKINVGEEIGYKYTVEGMGGVFQQITVSHGDYIFTISTTGYEDYLNQILSSFVFIN